jgi:hypothetical protein
MTLNRRWVICIGCIVLFLSGYFGSQLTTTSVQASSLDTTTSTTNNSQLLMTSTDLETGKQITIIDVKSKGICVYLIERGTGKIQFLSTRNASWDFQLDEYNSGIPTPREIKQLISQWYQKDFRIFYLSFVTNKGQTKVKQRELEYRTGEQVTYAHQGAKSPYSSSKPHWVIDFAREMSCFHKRW